MSTPQADLFATPAPEADQPSAEVVALVRARLQATLAASITGVAGPDGGTAEKPVGIVFIAVAGPRGVRVEHCQFAGDRDAICAQACDAALQMLLEAREGQNDRW